MLAVCLFCLIQAAFAGGIARKPDSRTAPPLFEPPPVSVPAAGTGIETGNGGSVIQAAADGGRRQGESAEPAQTVTVEDRGMRVMQALSAAYPGRIGPAEFRNGDWAVRVYEEWFYYAQGRLLPEGFREQAEEYDPQPFYNYTVELPPWHDPSPEENERFRNSAQRRRSRPPRRSHHFYDALWRSHSQDESYSRVKTIRLFGRSLMVHYSIMEELAMVEEKILELAKTDTRVERWINGLDTLTGWNWRNIADTQSRSFHAYGAALDLLPASQAGLATYWLWTSQNNSAWWTIPYEKRLHPPEAVIKVFELYGFIWGGKWLFYDTMHFEYRPEILILNGLPVITVN
jgi:hypothetical protein